MGERIGVLVTSVGKFGKTGFYNLQEVGLARALSRMDDVDSVTIVKAIDHALKRSTRNISDQIVLREVPTFHLGSNGFINLKCLDPSWDRLIYFADTQLYAPMIEYWAKHHNVHFVPYVGVIESKSASPIWNQIVKGFMKIRLFRQKDTIVFAKTPSVASELKAAGLTRVVIAPIGLDSDLLKQDFHKYDIEKIKSELHFAQDEKILLFVGRMEEEKHPFDVIKIFNQALQIDPSLRLLMIGDGSMFDRCSELVDQLNINEFVCIEKRVKYDQMWKRYVASEKLINFNSHEIFGMAILEAMYYGCVVVAQSAPGPNFILGHNDFGYVVNDMDDFVHAIVQKPDTALLELAHQRVIQKFSWKESARLLMCGETVM